MNPVRVLVATAQAFGASFKVAEGRVTVGSATPLPKDLLDKLKEHRQELISYLSENASATASQSTHIDPVGDIRPRTIPAASNLSALDNVLTEADQLLETFSAWAGDDTKRWNRALRALKRTWHPIGWKPETSRDLLVAWTAANYRLVAAQSDRLKLVQKQYLTRGQRVTLRARDSDISFFSQLASGLKSWAVDAVGNDPEGFRILAGLSNEAKEAQS